MLIDEIIEFCDKQYREHPCMDCKNESKCNHDCKICLDDLNYHRNELRLDYDCEHLLDYYVCRYSYKYCSEIMYALDKIDLSRYPCFNILSLGCGSAPDLMAFDCINCGKNITYWGFDSCTSWEKVHNKIISNFNGSVQFFRGKDVRNYFENCPYKNFNVIIIEYLISFFYNEIRENGVKEWFEQLAHQIVQNKLANSPLLVIINDVDSIYTGRDSFCIFKNEIDKLGLRVAEYRMHFKDNSYYVNSIRYLSKENKFSISNEFQKQYKVAKSCSSAQYILEVY